MIIDFLMGVAFMLGMLTAFMAWCSIGLLVLFITNTETKTNTETIVSSLFFPLIWLHFVLEYTHSEIEKRMKGAS